MLHCSTLSNLMSIVRIRVPLNQRLRTKEPDIFKYMSVLKHVYHKLHFYYITRKQIVKYFHIDLEITFERINNYMKYPIIVFKSV